MASINTIPAATQMLFQQHLSTPERIAALQQQIKAVLYTDSTGRLLAVTTH